MQTSNYYNKQRPLRDRIEVRVFDARLPEERSGSFILSLGAPGDGYAIHLSESELATVVDVAQAALAQRRIRETTP